MRSAILTCSVVSFDRRDTCRRRWRRLVEFDHDWSGSGIDACRTRRRYRARLVARRCRNLQDELCGVGVEDGADICGRRNG